MLYFSKLKLVAIYFIIIILSFFSFVNFIDNEDSYLLSKKVNLGLDLQGGSYLLLEVDSKPVIKQKLQSKLITLRKSLKNKNIKYQNLTINDEAINFKISENDIKNFDDFFLNKENLINTYYSKYRNYEMDYVVEDDFIIIKYTKFGIIEIKNNIL